MIDTETGAHLWAARFDGDRARLHELQTEITGQIARTLDLEMTAAEGRRAQRERPANPDAADLAMRGWASYNQQYSREHVLQAHELFQRALKIDPQLPEAWLGLARTSTPVLPLRWSPGLIEDLARAEEALSHALPQAPRNAVAHWIRGDILRGKRKFDDAIAAYETTVALNQNFAPAYASMGFAKIMSGRSAEAIQPVEQAIRISPQDPMLNVWLYFIGHAYLHLGQVDQAIAWGRKSLEAGPLWYAQVDLVAAYGLKRQDGLAKATLLDLQKVKPDYTVRQWLSEGWSEYPVVLHEHDVIAEGMRKAGLGDN